VRFAKTEFAGAFERRKLSAGVVVGVATLVVKSGDKVPALKLLTVLEQPTVVAPPVASRQKTFPLPPLPSALSTAVSVPCVVV